MKAQHMSITFQIIFGSLMLILCSFVHISLLVLTVKLIRWLDHKATKPDEDVHWGGILMVAFTMVVIAHAFQVWLWAATFVGLGALSNLSEAVYFSLVTYTTLGYGDVTVADGFKTFAAMAAATGLLNFGLSTAFLVGLLGKILPDD